MGSPQGVETGHEGRLVLETRIDKIQKRVLKNACHQVSSIDDMSFRFVKCFYQTIKMNIDWLIHLRYLEFVDIILSKNVQFERLKTTLCKHLTTRYCFKLLLPYIRTAYILTRYPSNRI